METVQPTSVTTASQDTVLGIPELIRNILSHLGDDGRSFKFASEVCWTWRHIALDFLYEGWDDLDPLFMLFGRTSRGDKGYEFSKFHDSPIQWDRIEFYTKRLKVLSLIIDDDDFQDHRACLATVLSAAQVAGRSPIFPRMRRLELSIAKPREMPWEVLGLVPHTLVELILEFNSIDSWGWGRIGKTLSTILGGAVQLSRLAIMAEVELKCGIDELISSQPSLIEVRFPLDPRSCEACGTLRSLRKVSINLLEDSSPYTNDDGLYALASSCPGLQKLSIYIQSSKWGVPLLRHLKRILQCGRLTDVEIAGKSVEEVDGSDIQTMASSWPMLKKLNLQSSEYRRGVQIGVLDAINHFMPNLQVLVLSLSEDIQSCLPKMPASAPQLIHRLRLLTVEEPGEEDKAEAIGWVLGEIYPRVAISFLPSSEAGPSMAVREAVIRGAKKAWIAAT